MKRFSQWGTALVVLAALSGSAQAEPGEYQDREIGEYVGTLETHEDRTETPWIVITGNIVVHRDAPLDGLILEKHRVQVAPGVVLGVHGKRARKNVRFARLRLGYEGDKRTVYAERGWPRYRHRENDQDIITEFWTYPEAHITYVFRGNELIRTQSY